MARTTHARKASGRARARRVDLVYALTHLSLETRALLVILLAALILRILPLGAFSTEFDEGVYWLSLGAMAQGHALYSSIYYAQPPFFLLSVFPWFALFGQTIIAARFTIVLYSLVGIVASYVIGNALAGRYVGLAAAALLAVDPLYAQLSRTLDAEVPSLAFMLAGVALGLHAARSPDRRDGGRRALIVASGALLGLALMAKLLAIVGIVPAAIVLAWPDMLLAPSAERAGATGRARRPARPRGPRSLIATLRAAWPDLALLAAGLLGAVLIALLPFLGSAGALYQQVVGLHLVASRVLGRGPLVNLGLIAGTGGEYWLFAAAVVALAVAIWRRAPVVVPVAAWAGATLVLLLAQQPLFAHHLVFLVPPLAVLAALLVRLAPPLPVRGGRRPPETVWLRAALRQPTLVTYGALILLGATVAVGLIIAAVEDERALAYPAGEQVLIAYTMSGVVPPGDVVVTDDPYLAGLVGLREPPEMIDTSLVRIETGSLTAKQLETVILRDDVRAVLFESGRFDRVPGFRAWVAHNFRVNKDFGGGRVLYVRGASGPVTV